MADAKKPRRKRRWDSGAPSAAPTTPPAAVGSGQMAEAVAKAQRAAMIQGQIQARLRTLNLPVVGRGVAAPAMPAVPTPPAARTGFSAVPSIGLNPMVLAAQRQAALAAARMQGNSKKKLRVDEQGRLVDETGKQVKLERPTSLLANKMEEDEDMSPADATAQQRRGPTESKFVDPSIHVRKTERAPRAFAFVKSGKYVKKAQSIRMRQLSREMRQRVKSAMVDSSAESSLLARAVPEVRREPIPSVEWWDAKILDPGSSYDDKLLTKSITRYQHHPVPIPPPAEAPPPPPPPLLLTKKERKKLKRQRKLEEQREKQDLIRFGVLEAPEPRVTLKNLMRVLEQDAIVNPSEVEARVRKQMAERKAKHEAHNAAKKLTPEERREKKRRKLAEDTSVQVHVALFRAGDLRAPQTRFKVDISTQQYNLTGCAILYEACNLIVVEGGPKGIKKFTRLMLHRIKWDEIEAPKDDEKDDSDSDDEDKQAKKPKVKAALVWQGVIARRNFKNFRVENCISEAMARKYLADKGVGHYWDMVRTYRDPSDDY